MGNNEQDPKQIIDVENDDNSSLIDKIIDIFSSNTTTGLIDDFSDDVRDSLCGISSSLKIFCNILELYDINCILLILEDKPDIFLIGIISRMLQFCDALALKNDLRIVLLDIFKIRHEFLYRIGLRIEILREI